MKRGEQLRPGIEITGNENSVCDVMRFLQHEKTGRRAKVRLNESSIQEERPTREKNLRARIELTEHPAFAMCNAPGGEGIEENRAARAGEIDAKQLMEARSGVRDDVVGKKFQSSAFADFDVSFLDRGIAERAIDARGGGGGEADARAIVEADARRKKIAAEYTARGIEQHGIGSAVIERDGALHLQRQCVTAARKSRPRAAALEIKRKESVAADAIEIALAVKNAVAFRLRRGDRGESSRRCRRRRFRL